MNPTATIPQATTGSRVSWSTELVGAAAAVACALVLWATLVPLGGLELAADMGGSVKQIGVLDIALTAFGAGLVGLLALRVLERFTLAAGKMKELHDLPAGVRHCVDHEAQPKTPECSKA